MFEIRPAQTEPEIQEFRTLCREYAESLNFDLDFQDFASEMETLPGDYAAPAGRILLAHAAETLVGCVAFRPLAEPGVCELKRLWVRPDHRGMGYGRRLVEAAISTAVGSDFTKICLDTVREMQAANGLYRSLGFREVNAYTFNPLPAAVYFALTIEQSDSRAGD